MAIKYLEQADLAGKRVLARFDFNVPLKEGVIQDSSRIDRSLETIRFLLSHGAKQIILMSHLGRPKGVQPEFSLEPVASYLAESLNEDVFLTNSAIDNGLKEFLALGKNKVIMLENLRFYPQEKANETHFAQALASYADIYVNDAFGVSHRKHASVHEIIRYFPRQYYAGFLIKKEVEALNKIIHKPNKPFVVLIGGAKVSDKIKTIEKLLRSVDNLLIGGAMAYPFLKAKSQSVGRSLCSDQDVELAVRILKSPYAEKITLPCDHICSSSLEENLDTEIVACEHIPNNLIGLDIGDKTVSAYTEKIKKAKTIFWNGPMGLFEKAAFAKGTISMAHAIAQTLAYSLVGGGDSVNAVNRSGLAPRFSHISTGGGASIEYIENGDLPGLRALRFGLN